MNQPIQINYYFDRVRINLFTDLDMLKDRINQNILEQYCEDVKIEEPYYLAKKWGYRSKIELFQATDEAIQYLQSCGLERVAKISRIEITKDEVYEDKETAEEVRDLFQASTYMKRKNCIYICSGTTYIGRPEHKWPNLYFLSYVPEETKLGFMDVWHREFVIKTWGRIKSKLNIETLNDLRTAQEHFEELEQEYIVQKELNRKRIAKHWPQKQFKNLAYFVEHLSQEKEQYRERMNRHRVMKILCGKRLCKKLKVPMRYKQSKHEKLILNQGLGYWLLE